MKTSSGADAHSSMHSTAERDPKVNEIPSGVHAMLSVAAEAVRLAEQRAIAGQLALEMMHEIKNPLETLGHLTFLTLAEAEDPDSVKRYMRLAEEQMDLLRQAASETLGFARTTHHPRAIAVSTLAEAALRIHQRTIDTKRIHLVKQLPRDIVANVHTGEMLQVFSNLIVNALDALPAEGTLSFRVRSSHGRVHFVIADNGHGVAEEHVPRIFEPFFTTKEDCGNGLGLALSKKIVERHSGTLRMRSSVRPGSSGTVFRVSIPA